MDTTPNTQDAARIVATQVAGPIVNIYPEQRGEPCNAESPVDGEGVRWFCTMPKNHQYYAESDVRGAWFVHVAHYENVDAAPDAKGLDLNSVGMVWT